MKKRVKISSDTLYLELFTLIRKKLWLQILIGFLLGAGCGVLLNPGNGLAAAETSNIIVSWLAIPGHIFLSLIQMIIIPLIFSSIIVGLVSNSNKPGAGKTGLWIGIYFLCSTAIAITWGIFLAEKINPGGYIDPNAVNRKVTAETRIKMNTDDSQPSETGISMGSFPDKIIAIIPENPFESMVNGSMFQVVIFSLIIGVALGSLKQEHAGPLHNLLQATQKVCMRVISGVMYIAPFAVFGLIAKSLAQSGKAVIVGLGGYVGTVLLGLLGLTVLYGCVLIVLARRNPFSVLNQCKELLLLAFSTSSSAAVMPLSIKTANDQLKIDPAKSQLVIPIGATINMDGTALYQGVATVFLAQAYGLQLDIHQLVIVVLTAISASIGTPGTPGVGIVILSVILKDIGVPPAGIALIIGVDRFLDMTRTAVNVMGDITATAVMDRWR